MSISDCTNLQHTITETMAAIPESKSPLPTRAQLREMLRQPAAIRFLRLLSFAPDDLILIQVFPVKERNSTGRPQNRVGTLAELWPWIVTSNVDNACTIAVAINPADGATQLDVKSIRSFWADDDTPRAEPRADWALPPHIVTNTSVHFCPETGQTLKKYHYFWRVEEGAITPKEAGTLQSMIALEYGTDSSLKDYAKKARLPGTLHLKNDEPFTCAIVSTNEDIPEYSRQQLLTAFGNFTAMAAAKESKSASTFDMNLPVVNEGGRDNWIFRFICSLRACGEPPEEIERQALEANKARLNPPLPESDILEKVEWVIAQYAPNRDRYPHTDLGNSERFAEAAFGTSAFNYSSDNWMVYSGKKWVEDEVGREIVKSGVRLI